jgi:hypothetical protein
MDKENFLIKFLIFSGWLEIGFGVLFIFMDSIFKTLGVPNSLFFSSASGVMIMVLGFLLWFSAKDIQRYLIIPVSSCIFRYIMAGTVEIVGILTISLLAPIFIGALAYDIFSATLTLILLKQTGYLPPKMESRLDQ